MTHRQVVEMSVTVNNSPIYDYVHPDDHTQPTYELKGGILFTCYNDHRQNIKINASNF